MKIRHTNILRTILKTLIVAMFLVFFIFIAIDTGSAVGEINVVIVYSKALAPYNDAISGFKDEFKAGNYLIDCTRYDLSSAQGKEEQFVNKIRNTNPTIIIAMGTEAALFSKLNFPDTTVIFSMVLNPVESGIAKNLKEPGKNITGVSLNIPIEDQFKKIKEMLPQVKSIGIIYNANKNIELVVEAEKAARKTRFELIAKPVYSEADVPGALKEIIKEADLLWAGVDPLVYNVKSSQYILLRTLREKVPFIAYSSLYVKAGALAAFECDYDDIGRQTARVAIEVIADKKAGSLPVAFPEKRRLIINKNTAKIIGVRIPRKVLEEAEVIF